MTHNRFGGPVRRAPIVAALLLFVACTDAPAPPLALGPDILVGEPIRERLISLEDSIIVGPVTDLMVVGDELIFPESLGHEVVVLDTLLRFRRRIGREGQGPGELRYPTDIELTPGGLLSMAEVGNARISVFQLDGRFVNTYAPVGQRVQLPLSDSTFLITPQQPGRRMTRVGSHSIEPFGPVEPSDDLAFSDFQYLVPARLEDGSELVAHIRGRDLSFVLHDKQGQPTRTVPAPTHRTLAELQEANEELVKESSRRWNARVLGSSEITVGQTSSNGRWIPIRYHQLETTYLYDVWRDRFHPIRFAAGERGLPASAATVSGSTLYVYLYERGLFAYEIDLPE